ncbi:MAG: tail fiber domain-containing protein [Candidatus Margulisiibacteriota bacterium]|jgi:hypothetical protein
MKKLLLGILVLIIISAGIYAVPNQLTYSGRLLQNGALVNSDLVMHFYIYGTATGGSPVWSTSNINVNVNQGIYSVVLDQVTANVFSGDDRYLEVQVGSEVLAPRTKINSVGYALQAGGLSVGGTPAVSVLANGNIGIGTTNPGQKLSVMSAVSGTQAQFGNNAYLSSYINGAYLSGAGTLAINGGWTAQSNAAADIGLNDNVRPGAIIFQSDSGLTTGNAYAPTTRMIVTSTGNIGIGKQNPDYRLDVSNGTFGTQARFGGSDGATGYHSTYGGNYYISAGADLTANGTWTARGAGGSVLGLGPDGVIGFYNYTGATIGQAPPILERLRIDNNGNVGIGTAVPSFKVEVAAINASLAVGGALGSTQNTGVQFLDTGTQHAGLRWSGDGSNNLTLEDASVNSNPSLWNGGTPVNFIVRNGKVGIGTTSPGARLSIKGEAYPSNLLSFHSYNEPDRYKLMLRQYTGSGANIGYGFDNTNDNTLYSNVLTMLGGNIGIGTNNPGARLHVYGSGGTGVVNIQEYQPGGGNTGGVLNLQATDNGGNALSIVSLSSKLASGAVGLGAGDLAINTMTGGVSYERMRIQSNGYIGVGLAGVAAQGILDIKTGTGRNIYVADILDGRPALFLKNNSYSGRIDLVSNGGMEVGTEGVQNVALFSNNLVRMTVYGSGEVGIGTTTTPRALLDVNGTAGNSTGVWANLSDIRLKKDIKTLANSLETILKLQGVSFHWKDAKKDKEAGLQRGFIAQDVEKVIPEWVRTDAQGYKMLEKVGVEAILVEAIKDQQKQFVQYRTEKEKEMALLKARLAALEKK